MKVDTRLRVKKDSSVRYSLSSYGEEDRYWRVDKKEDFMYECGVAESKNFQFFFLTWDDWYVREINDKIERDSSVFSKNFNNKYERLM